MDEPGLLLLEHLNVSIVSGSVSDSGSWFDCVLVVLYAHPLGYTLSWAFFRSPKTQMALSARQREHGLLPSHLGPGQFGCWIAMPISFVWYIPWTFLDDNDRKLYIRACGRHLSVSDRRMVLIVGQPWLCMCV